MGLVTLDCVAMLTTIAGTLLSMLQDRKRPVWIALADHPERLEELAGITAEYAKALHAIPCDTTVFGSTALSIREIIAGNKNMPEPDSNRRHIQILNNG